MGREKRECYILILSLVQRKPNLHSLPVSYDVLTDEPEIDVEAEKVHSGVGKEAHLTCIVHGEPRPTVLCLLFERYVKHTTSSAFSFQVRWFKENSELSSNDRIKIESKDSSHRHTLILRGLASQQDFGNYSCVAENSLGSSK